MLRTADISLKTLKGVISGKIHPVYENAYSEILPTHYYFTGDISKVYNEIYDVSPVVISDYIIHPRSISLKEIYISTDSEAEIEIFPYLGLGVTILTQGVIPDMVSELVNDYLVTLSTLYKISLLYDHGYNVYGMLLVPNDINHVYDMFNINYRSTMLNDILSNIGMSKKIKFSHS